MDGAFEHCPEAVTLYTAKWKTNFVCRRSKNLKPEIAVKALSDYLATEINIIHDIHRTEIYISEKEGLKELE